MNKTGFVIVVWEEGPSGNRIQNSTVYMSPTKVLELRNETLRNIFDENYAEMQQTHMVEINTPSTMPETGWISVDGTWVVTATIEAVEIDEDAD